MMEAQVETVRSIVGVFDSSEEAYNALEQLRVAGLGPDDEVSVMARDPAADEGVQARSTGSPVTGGAAACATIGGLIGAVLGWMLSINAISIPGFGSVQGLGSLAPTLAGLALGAVVGGLIGALLGIGVPVEGAAQVESAPHRGHILLTVHPGPALPAESYTAVMEANGGYDVRVYETPREPVGVSASMMEREAVDAIEGVPVEEAAADADETMATQVERERAAMNAQIEEARAQAMTAMGEVSEVPVLVEETLPEVRTETPVADVMDNVEGTVDEANPTETPSEDGNKA